MRRLAVVIVNFRTPELTLEALDSLAGQLDPGRDAVVVVDNASDDDSPDRIESWIAEQESGCEVSLVRAKRNGGFAVGNNLGIRAVAAEFYLLLNSDAALLPGACEILLATAEAHPRAGLVGVHLETPEGDPQTSGFRFQSPASELIDAAATGPVTRLLARWDVPLRPASELEEVEWTSFACVLVRREVFESAGLLDEGYFMYFEDVDLCRRAAAAGWRVLREPRARAWHRHGGSSEVPGALQRRRRPPAYLYHSRARYLTRFYGRGGLALANLLWLVGRSISFARELVGSKVPHTAPLQWLDIWRLGRGRGRPDSTVPTLSRR